MEAITPLVEVKQKALETALRYVMGNGYNQSETKALAALKRRCPGRTKAECLHWLQRSERVFRDCIEFLEQNEAAAFETFSPDTKDYNLLKIAVPIRRKFSDFPEKQLEWVLDLLFLYYHRK